MGGTAPLSRWVAVGLSFQFQVSLNYPLGPALYKAEGKGKVL